MAVRSMTAYATTTVDTVAGAVTIELKSVNSRFLDLQFKICDEFKSYEQAFREMIGQAVKRGKVECRLAFGRAVGNHNDIQLNEALFERINRLQQRIIALDATAAPMRVVDWLTWPGMIEEGNVDQELLQNQVHDAMSQTLKAFTAEREREGTALTKTLLEKVDLMRQTVASIEPYLPQMIETFQNKAVERMKTALGLALDGSENAPLTEQEAAERIRQEVTLYGMKVDVAEEIARLKIHLDETEAILTKGGVLGRRMDFMLQELNREANTLGSKAGIKALSDASMELKLLIEQIREQIQNIE